MRRGELGAFSMKAVSSDAERPAVLGASRHRAGGASPRLKQDCTFVLRWGFTPGQE